MSDGGAQHIVFGPYFDSAGVLYPNIKIYHYDAGTTNDADMWSDENKTTTVAQPFIGDTRGIARLFGDNIYKIVIHDENDNLIADYTWDNVQISRDSEGVLRNGTSFPSVGANNTWQMAVKKDGSGNLDELGLNNGASFKTLIKKSADDSAHIFDDIITKAPWADVRAYGAIGDGATNDSAAFQAAADAVYAAGGGTVYAPPGTFKLNTTVDLGQKVSFKGGGMYATVLTCLVGAFSFTDVDELGRMVISDCRLNGSGANVTTAIYMENAYNNFVLERVAIHFFQIGVKLVDSWTFRIDKCQISNNGCNVYLDHSGQGSIDRSRLDGTDAFDAVDYAYSGPGAGNNLYVTGESESVYVRGTALQRSEYAACLYDQGNTIYTLAFLECDFENNGKLVDSYATNDGHNTLNEQAFDVHVKNGGQTIIANCEITPKDVTINDTGTAIFAHAVRSNTHNGKLHRNCTLSVENSGLNLSEANANLRCIEIENVDLFEKNNKYQAAQGIYDPTGGGQNIVMATMGGVGRGAEANGLGEIGNNSDGTGNTVLFGKTHTNIVPSHRPAHIATFSTKGLAIIDATNATPIVIRTDNLHYLITGDEVFIEDVLGNTAANGTWIITVVDSNEFSLDTSVGNGTYTADTGEMFKTYSESYRRVAKATAHDTGTYDTHIARRGSNYNFYFKDSFLPSGSNSIRSFLCERGDEGPVIAGRNGTWIYYPSGESSVGVATGARLGADNLVGTGERDVACAANGDIIVTTSDERMKQDVVNLPIGLDAINQLRPVNYRWREDLQEDMGDNVELGLIAQELQQIIPELVSEDANGTLSVRYTRLIPVLINAIQELSDKVDNLNG